MNNYSELLKDPRWQKVRLEVFNRDAWRCHVCDSDKFTLHCHHISYQYGKEPWDYPMDNFLTLCAGCHEIETELMRIEWFSTAAKQAKMSAVKLWVLINAFAYVKATNSEKAEEIKGLLSDNSVALNKDDFNKFLSGKWNG